MKSVFVSAVAGAMLMLAGSSAWSADIARLEWGAFVVEDDSSGGFQDIKTAASDDGKSIVLTFSAMEAKADGATTEARNSVSGKYEVFQPASDPYTSCAVEIEGHVIKSAASVARLVVKVGGQEQVIEWPAGQALSEKFKKSLDVAMPSGGRLPSPFIVAVESYARKDGASDAAYVSVDTMKITAQHPQVAAR